MDDVPIRSLSRAIPASRIAARHARLFEMLRQRELATRALHRLHLGQRGQDCMPLPSPAALAATLRAQPDARSS